MTETFGMASLTQKGVMLFSQFNAPPLRATPAEGLLVPTTQEDGTTGTATKKHKQGYRLAEGMREGAAMTELTEIYKSVKKPVTEHSEMSEMMAGMVNHYYGGPNVGAPKHLKTIKDITRRYTGLADVPGARLQILNDEIRFTEDRKEGECTILTASKGVLAALTAILPLMDNINKHS